MLFTTFGTLVDLTKIKTERNITRKYFNSKKKKISFFVGGDGKSSKIMFKELENTIKELNLLSNKFEVIYCFSRRTQAILKIS